MGKWAMYRRRGSASLPSQPILLQSGGASCDQLESAPSGFRMLALKFTADDNAVLAAAELSLKRNASDDNALRVEIYSHNAGTNSPQDELDVSETIAWDSVPGVLTAVRFSGLSITIASGTIYWIVLRSIDTQTSGQMEWGGDVSAGRLMRQVAPGSGWSLASDDRNRCFDLFGFLT